MMFAVEVCSLPVTGGATGVAVAAVFLLVLGVIVARWVRASAGRVSIVAVVPLLLLGIGAASTQPSLTSCDSSAVTTTVPSVTTTVPEVAAPTTVAPTTTVVPVDPNLVLQIDTSQPGVGGASVGSMASSGSVSNLTTYIFELGLFGDVNVSIDWGDNTLASVATTAGVASHTYATSGQYEIRVSGTLTGFGQSPYSNPLVGAEYLVGVSSFGTLGLTSLDFAFWSANNLVSVPSVLPSTVVSLEDTFWAATLFNDDISSWDTANVTNMTWMFEEAASFNGDISAWDTSSVVNMGWMFSDASSFAGDISAWNTSSVTDMSGMFFGASAFDQSLSSWDTSSVTDMNYMFFGASLFNQSLNSWDTSNATDMSGMFSRASAFNQSLSSWDTSKVTNMSVMFYYAASFNGDISAWDTSSVADMSGLFQGATSFNGVISNWKTGSVTDMNYMFSGASAFNQSLSSWNVSLVTNMQNMLSNSAMSSANYAATLIGWASQSVKPIVQLGASGLAVGAPGSEGCDAQSELESSPRSWTISDSSQCFT